VIMKTDFFFDMTPCRLLGTDVSLQLSTSTLRRLYLEEASFSETSVILCTRRHDGLPCYLNTGLD